MVRSVAEGLFFCCGRERLFHFDFTGFSFVISLLVSSAFPCRPHRDQGRSVCGHRLVVVDRPRWFGTIRRLAGGDFFLFEAPRWPLVCKFFCDCEFLNESCSLLYFCSEEQYFLSRLSHSFLIRSWSCSKLAPPLASSSMAVSSVVFPKIISVDNFFSMISLLFSSICFLKLTEGIMMMHYTVLRKVCSPLLSGSWRDLVWSRCSVSRSAAVVYVFVSGWIKGDGVVSMLWWAQ